MTGECVARVAALWRYPVKSMRGEALQRARLYWHGLEGDRRYAFVQSGNLSQFPWLTARELPAMLRYEPYLTSPDEGRSSPIRVRTPDGADQSIEEPELLNALARLYGAPIHLIQLNRGAPDSAHVSVLGLPSVRAIEARVGAPVDARRFRQNILIEPTDNTPFVEETWLGRALQFGDGDARLRLNRPDERCMLVNLDPDTTETRAAVLRQIAQSRDACLGLYAAVEALGEIEVGDPVYLI